MDALPNKVFTMRLLILKLCCYSFNGINDNYISILLNFYRVNTLEFIVVN